MPYRIFPGQIVIVDGEVTDYNTPYAPDDIGDANVTIEMGSLYTMDSNYEGDPNAGYNKKPGLGPSTLLKFYVSGACNYEITENLVVGGVVMEDPNENRTVHLCSGRLLCTVPDVVDQLEATATAAITTAGFTLGTRTTACHATIIDGNVISTTPAAGAQPCGTAVAYVVSTGICQVAVPDINTMTVTNANNAITGAGSTVGTLAYSWHATIAKDLVCVQSPAAGTMVNPGSAVNKTVSRGVQPTNCITAGTAYDTQRGQFASYVTNLWDPTQWCAYDVSTNPKGGYQCHGDADAPRLCHRPSTEFTPAI